MSYYYRYNVTIFDTDLVLLAVTMRDYFDIFLFIKLNLLLVQSGSMYRYYIPYYSDIMDVIKYIITIYYLLLSLRIF